MHKALSISVLSHVLVYCASAQAQSLSVFGGNEKALECYMNATLVAVDDNASMRMLEPCTYALDYSSLGPRDRAATYTNRGVLRVALGRFEQALADYDASMKLIPDAGENYINRGNVHYQMGDFQRAIVDYSTAVELDVNEKHIAWFDRGMAFERAGDPARAEEDYRTALTFMPGWALAETRLRSLLARQQEAAAAGQSGP
jgi:tetratricopeptide (TPR) repeat protein